MTTDGVVRVLGVAMALALSACAGRAFPSQFPEGSAASLSAPAGTPARLTTALDQDPPLPGEPTEAWPGLQPALQPAHEHAHTQTSLRAAAVYACPMHPEVTSDRPGTCSKCGMALVKKP